MDYLTRRSVASQGVRGALLRARSQWPHVSALGVRVERDGTVHRQEIITALNDIAVRIELPANDRLDASAIEKALADLDPTDLKRRIDAFLEALSQSARSQ